MELVAWIFNLGYLFQHIGTLLQIRRIENKKNIEGVSIDTQILFLLGTIARCIWISDTILKSHYVTYIELCLALVTLFYTLYICLLKYNKYKSIFSLICGSSVPILFRWYILVIVVGVLSVLFYPGKGDNFEFDVQILVSFTIYVEAAGLIPQIYSVVSEKDSRIFSSFYLVFLAISRICRLVFWVKLYLENNDFEFLIIADVMHLVVFLVFVYFYFTNLNKLILPTNNIKNL